MDHIFKKQNMKRVIAYFVIISILLTGVFAVPVDAHAASYPLISVSNMDPKYIPVLTAAIVLGYEIHSEDFLYGFTREVYNNLPIARRTWLTDNYTSFPASVSLSSEFLTQVQAAIENTNTYKNITSGSLNSHKFNDTNIRMLQLNYPYYYTGSDFKDLFKLCGHYIPVEYGTDRPIGGNYYYRLVATSGDTSRLYLVQKENDADLYTQYITFESDPHYHNQGPLYVAVNYINYNGTSNNYYFQIYRVNSNGEYVFNQVFFGSGTTITNFHSAIQSGALGSSQPTIIYNPGVNPSSMNSDIVIQTPTNPSAGIFLGKSSQDALDGKLVSVDKNMKTLVLSAGYAAAFYQYRPDDGSFDYASLVLWSENNPVRRRQIPGIEDNYYDHGLRYSVVDGWPTEGPVDVLNENPILMKNFYDNWGYITNTRGAYIHMGLGLNKSLVVYNTFIYWGDDQTPYRNNELLIRYNASAYKVKVYSITTKDNDGLFPDGIEYSQYQPYDPYPDLPNADDEPVNLIDIDDPRWIDNTDFDYVMPDPSDPGSPPSSIDYNPPPTGGSIGGLEPGSIYKDEDLNLIGSVKKLVNDFKQMIIDLFVAPVGAIKSMISSGTAFMGVVKDMFSWLPGDITTVIFSGLTLMVVIGVLKMLL